MPRVDAIDISHHNTLTVVGFDALPDSVRLCVTKVNEGRALDREQARRLPVMFHAFYVVVDGVQSKRVRHPAIGSLSSEASLMVGLPAGAGYTVKAMLAAVTGTVTLATSGSADLNAIEALVVPA
jgi:hypothetical protein